jgi:hypothetical protein
MKSGALKQDGGPDSKFLGRKWKSKNSENQSPKQNTRQQNRNRVRMKELAKRLKLLSNSRFGKIKREGVHEIQK